MQCKYFDCRSQKKLISCPYCQEKFCGKHITSKPTMEAPFYSKIPDHIVEQWRNPNAHPCGVYTSELNEAERIKKNTGWTTYPQSNKWKELVREQTPIEHTGNSDLPNYEIQNTSTPEPVISRGISFSDVEKYLIIFAIAGSVLIVIFSALGFFK